MTTKHRDSAIIVAICIVIGLAITVKMLGDHRNGGGDQSSRVATTSSERITPLEYMKTTEAVGSDSPAVSTKQSRGCSPAVAVYIESVDSGIGNMPIKEGQEITVNDFVTGRIYTYTHPMTLFQAIRIVEADDGEVGPAGERGPFRITPGYWHDAVEQWVKILDDSYITLARAEQLLNYDKKVTDPKACEAIMYLYWTRYGALTDEERSRVHNGGPTGIQKESTKEYWKKVKTILEQGEQMK